MGRTVGVNTLLSKKFKTYENLSPKWREGVGDISRPFKALIFGAPKNGKTAFTLQFCKEMSNHCKVYYNSCEEGHSKTLQDNMRFNKMEDCRPGRFMLGDRDNFTEMMEKIKRIHAHLVVIDSRDYMQLTVQQWKKLTTTYPKKSFILICWEQSGKPAGKYAKDIEFMVDMVIHVRQFMATTNGRFGAGLKYRIWDRKPVSGEQLTMQINNN